MDGAIFIQISSDLQIDGAFDILRYLYLIRAHPSTFFFFEVWPSCSKVKRRLLVEFLARTISTLRWELMTWSRTSSNVLESTPLTFLAQDSCSRAILFVKCPHGFRSSFLAIIQNDKMTAINGKPSTYQILAWEELQLLQRPPINSGWTRLSDSVAATGPLSLDRVFSSTLGFSSAAIHSIPISILEISVVPTFLKSSILSFPMLSGGSDLLKDFLFWFSSNLLSSQTQSYSGNVDFFRFSFGCSSWLFELVTIIIHKKSDIESVISQWNQGNQTKPSQFGTFCDFSKCNSPISFLYWTKKISTVFTRPGFVCILNLRMVSYS